MSDSTSPEHGARSSEPLYVGYRPLPPRDRRALLLIIPALALGLGALGGLIAGAQRTPGAGAWHADVRDFTGTLTLVPFPMLLMEGHGYFLVAEGKHGVHDRVKQLDGSGVRIRGTLIERDGRRLIEVASTQDAIEIAPELGLVSPPPIVAAEPPRAVSILAEIVDGKCYLGAMKPGNAKAHKACATLCIEGGLPPLVIELKTLGSQFTCPPTSIQPTELLPILRVNGSTALPPEVLAMVAEPVRIEGTLTTVRGVPVIDTTTSQITRATR